MPQSHHGIPCWYELATPDTAAAGRFYGAVLGWTLRDAQVPGFDYHLAQRDGHMVAGLTPPMPPGTPPSWTLYFAVDSADQTAAAAAQGGGQVLVPPSDIPNTGRFAVLADPQGAVFAVLQPLPMPEDRGDAPNAFAPMRPGHGTWHELMARDPEAAFGFYSRLFGWTAADAFDLGEGMGRYQIVAHQGQQIGGMMGLAGAPAPYWLPYFAVEATTPAMERIRAAGGSVMQGPMEAPGPVWIALAQDPQGAMFAVVSAVR